MTFSEYLDNLDPFYWIYAGIALCVLELLVRGRISLIFGLAAMSTGGIYHLLGNLDFQGQLMLFGALVVVFALLFWLFRPSRPTPSIPSNRGERLSLKTDFDFFDHGPGGSNAPDI
ncbi:MAG: NfeD family protein [bacterium]|nr:NfeD family protein [bacterium]